MTRCGRSRKRVAAGSVACRVWIIGAVFQTLVPLFGTSTYIGLSITGVGFALGVATATELVALFPAGKASDRRGRRAVLIPALAGLALTTALLGQVSTPLAFIVVLGALGVASAYSGVPPAPMLSDVAPEQLKGTAVGVFRFVGDLGFVLGPLEQPRNLGLRRSRCAPIVKRTWRRTSTSVSPASSRSKSADR